MNPKNWTKIKMLGILCACYLSAIVCFGQQEKLSTEPNGGESIQLQEAKNARESAEKRVLELELELDRLRKECNELRSKYARLYLQSHGTLQKLRNLELGAANIIQNKDKSDAETARDEAVEALNLVQTRIIQAQNTFADFEKYISAMMDALQPSQAVRAELEKRKDSLKNAVDAALNPLSQVARQHSEPTQRKSANVVSIKPDAEIVILDRGALSGVRPGKKWSLKTDDGTLLVQLTTVDVRTEFSAAVPLKGSIHTLGVGAVLQEE